MSNNFEQPNTDTQPERNERGSERATPEEIAALRLEGGAERMPFPESVTGPEASEIDAAIEEMTYRAVDRNPKLAEATSEEQTPDGSDTTPGIAAFIEKHGGKKLANTIRGFALIGTLAGATVAAETAIDAASSPAEAQYYNQQGPEATYQAQMAALTQRKQLYMAKWNDCTARGCTRDITTRMEQDRAEIAQQEAEIKAQYQVTKDMQSRGMAQQQAAAAEQQRQWEYQQRLARIQYEYGPATGFGLHPERAYGGGGGYYGGPAVVPYGFTVPPGTIPYSHTVPPGTIPYGFNVRPGSAPNVWNSGGHHRR